jgi:hypothetical protein
VDDLTCQLCLRHLSADAAGTALERLSWVMDRDGDTVRWTCPACAATHVRSMEAKLAPPWW